MNEPVSSGGSDRRFRSQTFDHVRHTQVHDARHLAKRSQTRPAKKAALPAHYRRPYRRHGTIGAAEVPFGLVTESVANFELTSLPSNFLVYAQFLYLLQPYAGYVVIAHAS